MNQLIPITTNENQEPCVSGRTLHEFLEVKTAYKDWMPRMIEYGFVEGEDFSSFLSESTGGRPSVDHVIKMNMAKELCMIQRTERGKQARQYFIEVERKFNSPDLIMARALVMAQDKIKLQDLQIKQLEIIHQEMKPKVQFAEAVEASDDSILIREFAKILQQDGIPIGANRLFEWLRMNGYIIRANASDRNKPTQRTMEMGLMQVKTTTIQTPDGQVKVRNTPKITGKGQVYFHRKLKEQMERELSNEVI